MRASNRTDSIKESASRPASSPASESAPPRESTARCSRDVPDDLADHARIALTKAADYALGAALAACPDIPPADTWRVVLSFRAALQDSIDAVPRYRARLLRSLPGSEPGNLIAVF